MALHPPPPSPKSPPPPAPKRQKQAHQKPRGILKTAGVPLPPQAPLEDSFDHGGQDQETLDIIKALEEVCPTDTDDHDVEIIDEDSSDLDPLSDEPQIPLKPKQPHPLKAFHLRPPTVRTRVLTHRNGLPDAIKWMQTKGLSLSRFIAGHENRLRPRDRQELEALSTALFLLVDQFQPQHVILIDAADALIRRIMSICLQDKLDGTFLSVLANPSGSHLAPLEWISEANRVYKITKKAHLSRSSSPQPAHQSWSPPAPKAWRHRTHSSRPQDSNSRRSQTHKRRDQSPRANRNRGPQSAQSNGRKGRSDGGRGAGNESASSNHQN